MFPTNLARGSGDSLLFQMLGTPLKDPSEPNGTEDLYEAMRSGDGWQIKRRLSPSGEQAVFPNAGGVSADHLYDFTQVGPVNQTFEGGTLAANGNTTYLGNPDGSFEILGIGSLGIEPQARGRFIGPSGDHIIFTVSSTGASWCSSGDPCDLLQLEPDAPPSGTAAIYDRSADGFTKVISLLPNNVVPAPGEDAEYQGVSSDGSVVAFKIGGTLYVRVDDERTEEVAAGNPTFAGISDEGSWIYYVAAGNIYAFAIDTENTSQVNGSGDGEVVNMSADGTHLYFISPSQLVGSSGTAGQPNLYLWTVESGEPTFIATVDPGDLSSSPPALNTWTSWAVAPMNTFATTSFGPAADTSRTTPDGRTLVFQSRAKLTAYENNGHIEIYRFDEGQLGVRCISCNPDGTPATQDARFQDISNVLTAEAVIHNLSIDGRRVFFETSERLRRADTDGLNDIYEWQEDEEGNVSLELISSGESQEYTFPFGGSLEPNIMFAVTPDGNNVFFLSRDPLVSTVGSGGVQAIYDARVDGGFSQPPLPMTCSGESCQQSASTPSLSAPRSNGFAGKGNVHQNRRRCRHQKRARRGGPSRCRRHHSARKHHKRSAHRGTKGVAR